MQCLCKKQLLDTHHLVIWRIYRSSLICQKSVSLVLNSSNTDALTWWPTQPTSQSLTRLETQYVNLCWAGNETQKSTLHTKRTFKPPEWLMYSLQLNFHLCRLNSLFLSWHSSVFMLWLDKKHLVMVQKKIMVCLKVPISVTTMVDSNVLTSCEKIASKSFVP